MNIETLEQYLIMAFKNGQIDHSLRVSMDEGGKVTFYIHPQIGDGETPSFVVRENAIALCLTSDSDVYDHATEVLYPGIKAAMDELGWLHNGFNDSVDRAFNHLHRAYWSETPAPESAPALRPEQSAEAVTPVMGNCDAIEQEIQAKGLTAPRITPAEIEANIASEHYFTAADGARMSSHGNHPIHNLNTGSLGLLTFCVLVLRNGFTVTGESACASPENFDAEIGRKIARQNAIDKVWPLMGYELRSRLHQRATTCTCGPNDCCSGCGVGLSGE